MKGSHKQPLLGDEEENEEEESKAGDISLTRLDKDHNDTLSESDDDENVLAVKSVKVIKELVTRHYAVIFFCTVLGASIGFIVYLVFSYDVWVSLLAIVGFVVGVVLDKTAFKDKQRTNLMSEFKLKTTADSPGSAQSILNAEWIQSADDVFYNQSDFFSIVKNEYRGSSRVYRKQDSGALVFEKRAQQRIENYQGVEIGGGISAFIGTCVSLLISWGDQANTLHSLLYMVLCIIVFGLLGCICERELRKWNYLSPIDVCVVVRDSIALHDISHICCVSCGYSAKQPVSDKSIVETAAIAYFKVVASVFYTIYIVIRTILYAFWINPAFVLWLSITLSLFFLFPVNINKVNTYLLDAMWCVIAACVVSFLCAWFVAPCCRKPIKIGTAITIEQLKHERLDARQQTMLFKLFSVTTFLLILCACCVVTVTSRTNPGNLAGPFFSLDEYSLRVWNGMVCKEGFWPDETETNHTDSSIDMNNYDAVLQQSMIDKLCGEPNFALLTTAVVVLSVLWYVLLAAAAAWNFYDKYQVKLNLRPSKRVWTQYCYLYVYRKSQTIGVFSKCYSIEMTEQDAKAVQLYLNQECAWYSAT